MQRKQTEQSPPEIVTLSVFHFPEGKRLWPFVAMASAGRRLAKVDRLGFRKMMGAGRGIGFSARPDFGRYALLGAWKEEAAADSFLRDSRFMNLYRRRAERVTTWYLSPRRVHGRWDGKVPFGIFSPTPSSGGADPESPDEVRRRVAVMTRATVRLVRLRDFWQMVSPVSDELAAASGLVWSIGVGELPWIRQATFSVWESEEAMKAFAYGAPRHREVVRRTREERWYSEDLFARFSVHRVEEWVAAGKE